MNNPPPLPATAAQVLGLCGYSFKRYSEKCFAKFIELCMKTPCWCPPEEHQPGGRKVTETSVIEFCHRIEKLLL